MNKPLNWHPVRHGRVYCSSACGGKCLWSKYQSCKRIAEATAAALGPDWAGIVKENLGWHVEVRHRSWPIRLTPVTGASKVSWHCNVGGRWTGTGRTPRAALRKTVGSLRTSVDTLTALLDRADDALRNAGVRIGDV